VTEATYAAELEALIRQLRSQITTQSARLVELEREVEWMRREYPHTEAPFVAKTEGQG